MKNVRTFVITFSLLAFGPAAVAANSTSDVIRRQAPKGISATFYSCIDSAGSDTVATAACLSTEKITQDTRLNTAYKALIGKLDGESKSQLIRAERAWLKFQNEDGSFQNGLYGSETAADLQLAQNDIFSLCERANVLEKYLSIANDK